MKFRVVTLFVVALYLFASLRPVGAQDAQFGESPMLAEQVKAGKLPPVKDRLPSSPRVIEYPGSEIGTYGGDFRDPFKGDGYWASQMVFWSAWKSLVNWNETYTDYVPNIAEKIDISPDAKEYTFHLRPGTKWSDGQPFTSEDVEFYINDVLNNKELNKGTFPDGWLKPGKEAPTVTVKDANTFTLKFDVSYGMFLLNMCGWPGWEIVAAPKHYLKQFHIKYNPDGIKDLIPKTEGATDWITLFQAHSAVGVGGDPSVVSRDVNYPTMFPWIYKQPLGTGTQFIAERNPYYYWVDKKGNQLPYIDRIVGSAYQDDQTMLVDVLAGKFDTMANTTDQQRSLFFDNQATSGLKVYPVKSEGGGTVSVSFNMTHPDLGKIFSQKDFRVGMSYAINRKEIIDIVYFGQGTPRQLSPVEDSPLYNKQLSTQYLDFNVDEANKTLDKVLAKKDADGFRLNPDSGKRLSVVFTVQKDDYGLRFADVAQLLKKYFAKVGIEVVVDVVSNDVWTQRSNDNSMEATIFTGEGGYGITAITDPRNYVPFHGQSIWGNGWQLWYLQVNNKAKVEPPQVIKDQVDLYKKVLQAPTGEERLKLMKQVLQTTADNFWVIGISSASDSYRPLSAKLGNVPKTWVGGWNPGGTAIAFPEQWFFRK